MFCLSFSISKMQIVVPAPFQEFFKDAQVRSTTPRTCTHTDKEEIHLKFSSRTKEQRTQRNQIIRKGNQLENQHTLDTDENVMRGSTEKRTLRWESRQQPSHKRCGHRLAWLAHKLLCQEAANPPPCPGSRRGGSRCQRGLW